MDQDNFTGTTTMSSKPEAKRLKVLEISEAGVQLKDVGSAIFERSYQRLALDIMTLIDQGELSVGDRLPSERTLAERFDVSRTSVREAIIALEIRGIVEVRGNSGIYVRGTKPAHFLKDAAPGPFELLGARLIIEPEVAALAAIRAKDSDMDGLSALIGELRRTMHDKRANEIADRKFHVAIATATGNSVLIQVVNTLWERVRGSMWAKLEEHFHTAELREAAMRDHRAVFSALVARDPVAARSAMRSHIERVMSEFAQGWA
jgi:DNA-binding FadR family transcriptional regulator